MRAIKKESGFTLLEIMIVMAIMVSVLARVAPNFANPSFAIRAAVRHIAALSRYLDNNARLMDVTYRLAIQMDPHKGYAYWVESASGSVTMLSAQEQKKLSELSDEQRKQIQTRNHFTLAKSITKKPQVLPDHLKFLGVEFADGHLEIKRGIAYIHYFPQGLAQEAAIHIGDGKHLHWTLAIRPLTGEMDVLPKNISLEELDQ